MLALSLPYQPHATAWLRRLRPLGAPVLLHSAERSTRFGRFDILSAAPRCRYRLEGGTLFRDSTCLWQAGTSTHSPLDALRRDLEQQLPDSNDTHSTATPDMPFRRGYLGYFGYPLHALLEQHDPPPADPAGLPLLFGGCYDWSIVTDHRRRRSVLWATDSDQQRRVEAALERPAEDRATDLDQAFQPSLSRRSYRNAFERIRAFTEAGDCYQINFARHFSAAFSGDPLTIYEQWLRIQPAPFAAYLEDERGGAVLSLSPERFLRVRRQEHALIADVSPIKGTRRRGTTASGDRAQRLKLLRSAKDRAENLMIVDLLRNDLGRVAQTGTVTVTHLCEPLTFANVHHLVSTIRAELAPPAQALEAFEALFPSGSITGAPKLRAIDIINTLEPVGRSVYCGAIGYLNEFGEMDSSVAIRTGVAAAGRLHLWGGGGLVLDSAADAELDEIHHKIGGMLEPFA
ncbi:MAG: anthranilate synthase component I family protein [Pseudomonadota bacterium]